MIFSKLDQPVETDPSAGMAMDMAGTYPSSCIVSAQTLLSGKDPQLTPARGSLHKLYKKTRTRYTYILCVHTKKLYVYTAHTQMPLAQKPCLLGCCRQQNRHLQILHMNQLWTHKNASNDSKHDLHYALVLN